MPKPRKPLERIDRRVLPVSSVSAYKAFEEAFPNDDEDTTKLKKFMERSFKKPVVALSLDAFYSRREVAMLAPEIDQDGIVGFTIEEAIFTGGALFQLAVEKEAGSQRVAVPRLTARDNEFWINRHFSSEDVNVPRDSLQAYADFGRNAIGSLIARGDAMSNVETDFSLHVLGAFRPELGYGSEMIRMILMGAADVRSRYEAYYELRELEQATK